VVALVLIGPCACGGFPNFIFILFLFFFPAPSQTRRYLRSYRGKREEEKEGKKGGGEEEPRNARSFSNSTIHQSAPGLILVSLSILFFSILAFISFFFSLYLHTPTEKERKR
jgi:hypothetical protein